MALNYKSNYFLVVALNILSLSMFLYFGRYNPDLTVFGFNASYSEFVVIGISLQMVVGTSISTTSSSLATDISIGTWSSILPYFNFLEYAVGVSLAGVSLAVFSVIFAIFTAYLICGFTFHIAFSIEIVFMVIILFILILAAHIAISLILAAHTIWFKKQSGFAGLIYQLTRAFTGIAFPVAMLNGVPLFISRSLPLTYGLESLQDILLNEHWYFYQIMLNSLVLLVFIIVLTVVSIFLVHLAITNTKKKGTVEAY